MIGVSVCLKAGQTIRLVFEEEKAYKFCKKLEDAYAHGGVVRIHEPGGAPIYYVPGKSIAAWYCHDKKQSYEKIMTVPGQ